jgi:hypothetical protein
MFLRVKEESIPGSGGRSYTPSPLKWWYSAAVGAMTALVYI